jgi:signal transduction histidine kinase
MQEGILSYSEGRIRAVAHLANLYESLGQKDSTLKYYKMSLQLNEKMFDREKIREAQSLAFNEKIHQQELKEQNEKEQNRIKIYGLLGLSVIFLVIVFFLWRNNQQKQKAKSKIEQAYDDLKTTQQQLIQSEKMASLGELTAGIAHEIQNPLNFVNNFSEVNDELLKELATEADKGNLDEVKAIAKDITFNSEKINHHGKRADAIVKGMLQHSRSSSGQKEPTDLNALADEYLRLAYHGLRAKDKSFNAHFTTDFDNSIDKIDIIPQDIGRVILNLINNAFYAVDEKKKQIGDGYEPTVSVSTKKEKDKVEIKVKDNGNGIPQKLLDKIFQPFFTTKPAGQGTGLGLSLSYDIVKAHGGEIKAETEGTEGSIFKILLPA